MDFKKYNSMVLIFAYFCSLNLLCFLVIILTSAYCLHLSLAAEEWDSFSQNRQDLQAQRQPPRALLEKWKWKYYAPSKQKTL